jgi:type VI secretion system secreted protein VgrG
MARTDPTLSDLSPVALPVLVSFQGGPSFAHVHRYVLEERLHQPFELEIEVRTVDPALDPGGLDGMVREIKQTTAEPTGESSYVLTIVPPLWLASRRTEHRIFQDVSVPEIVQIVLSIYGDGVAPRQKLSRGYRKREYTVQYGETDLDFVLRLCADEGISIGFLHDPAEGTSMVLLDDTTAADAVLEAPFVPPAGSGVVPTAPHVQEVSWRSGIESQLFSLRDYDFERPALGLDQAANAASKFAVEEGLERYRFEVGQFKTEPDGQRRARDRLEAERACVTLLRCTASFGLSPGARFVLLDHPRHEANGPLTVLAARTMGEQVPDGRTLRHELECIPASVPFRPAPRPKPRIWGTHSAFVVGGPGMEIDVDEHGRVEVEFRWDRRDWHRGGTSRRIRVGQGWAGAGFGHVLLPRVNEEVIVAYLDGDPDEPVIVGRLFNGWNRPALNPKEHPTVSAWRSRSSPGGQGYNEILMEDLAGSERLALHAARDFVSETVHDSTHHVGHDYTVVVDGNNSTQVGASGQGHSSTSVAGNMFVAVEGQISFSAPEAFFVSSLGNIELVTTADRVDRCRNHFMESSALYIKCGDVMQVNAAYVDVFAGERIHLQVGGSTITMTPGEIVVKSPLIKLNP